MKSIIIGRPSTTTAEPEEDEEDDVGFKLYKKEQNVVLTDMN